MKILTLHPVSHQVKPIFLNPNLNTKGKNTSITEIQDVDLKEIQRNAFGYSYEIAKNAEKVYLKFMPVKGCDRSVEVRDLQRIGVIKMPLVKFAQYDDRNLSVYELCFSIEADFEKLDRYFDGNRNVKRLSEKDIAFFHSSEFIPMRRAELKEATKQTVKIK